MFCESCRMPLEDEDIKDSRNQRGGQPLLCKFCLDSRIKVAIHEATAAALKGFTSPELSSQDGSASYTSRA